MHAYRLTVYDYQGRGRARLPATCGHSTSCATIHSVHRIAPRFFLGDFLFIVVSTLCPSGAVYLLPTTTTAACLVCCAELLDQGWRRSGKFLYRPENDVTCCRLYTIRLDTTRFVPSKQQCRLMRRWQRFLDGAGQCLAHALYNHHCTAQVWPQLHAIVCMCVHLKCSQVLNACAGAFAQVKWSSRSLAAALCSHVSCHRDYQISDSNCGINSSSKSSKSSSSVLHSSCHRC
jgi:Arginine-tRNA-protein transferase, N terminus